MFSIFNIFKDLMKQLLRVVLVKILQCEEQREFWKLENKIPTQEQLVAALRMNTVREKKGGKSGYVGQGKTQNVNFLNNAYHP